MHKKQISKEAGLKIGYVPCPRQLKNSLRQLLKLLFTWFVQGTADDSIFHPMWSPRTESGWIHLKAFAFMPYFHLARLLSIFLLQTNFPNFLRDWLLYVLFCCSLILLPAFSYSNAFLRTSSSSLLNTSPYHCTPFVFPNLSKVSFSPSMYINFSIVLLSISFS